MAIYKRGDTWWFKFKWNGETIRQSTKQGNQRIAGQIEATRKTQLAKGEVGIQDHKPVPTLGQFAELEFLPFVREHKKEKPRTVQFYQDRIARLKTFSRLWNAKLDAIEPEHITAYMAGRQKLEMATSTINRDLATLRRMFKLAAEWRRVSVSLPKVRLLAGENRRERVVTRDEEKLYLEAAAPLLKDFAVLQLDTGLRPEEAYRLKWSQIRNGNIEIHTGKTKAARRSVPASPRVLEMLERHRPGTVPDEWVFPAPTSTGHINFDSLKKQHAAALKASGVDTFVIYSLRHTCLTRWAESGMDVFSLMKLSGHAEMSTTKRYVHMNDAHARAAIQRSWEAQGGHKSGHSAPKTTKAASQRKAAK